MIKVTQAKLESLTWAQWLEVWKASIVLDCPIVAVWDCGNVETIDTYGKLENAYDRLGQIQV